MGLGSARCMLAGGGLFSRAGVLCLGFVVGVIFNQLALMRLILRLIYSDAFYDADMASENYS